MRRITLQNLQDVLEGVPEEVLLQVMGKSPNFDPSTREIAWEGSPTRSSVFIQIKKEAAERAAAPEEDPPPQEDTPTEIREDVREALRTAPESARWLGKTILEMGTKDIVARSIDITSSYPHDKERAGQIDVDALAKFVGEAPTGVLRDMYFLANREASLSVLSTMFSLLLEKRNRDAATSHEHKWESVTGESRLYRCVCGALGKKHLKGKNAGKTIPIRCNTAGCSNEAVCYKVSKSGSGGRYPACKDHRPKPEWTWVPGAER